MIVAMMMLVFMMFAFKFLAIVIKTGLKYGILACLGYQLLCLITHKYHYSK